MDGGGERGEEGGAGWHPGRDAGASWSICRFKRWNFVLIGFTWIPGWFPNDAWGFFYSLDFCFIGLGWIEINERILNDLFGFICFGWFWMMCCIGCPIGGSTAGGPHHDPVTELVRVGRAGHVPGVTAPALGRRRRRRRRQRRQRGRLPAEPRRLPAARLFQRLFHRAPLPHPGRRVRRLESGLPDRIIPSGAT